MALSGNKCDQQPWMITKEQEDEFIRQQGLKEGDGFIRAKTSSKTGEGIREMFQQIATSIVKIKLNE